MTGEVRLLDLEDLLDQTIPDGLQSLAFLCLLQLRQPCRLAKSRQSIEIFGAGHQTLLLTAAENYRLNANARFDVQRARPLRTVKIVRGKGEQIDAVLLHIDRDLARRGSAVHVQKLPFLVHKIAHLFYGLNGSNLAVGVHHRGEDGLLAKQSLQDRQIDNAHAVHRNQGEVKAALLQIFQGIKHGDVLNLASQQLLAFSGAS